MVPLNHISSKFMVPWLSLVFVCFRQLENNRWDLARAITFFVDVVSGVYILFVDAVAVVVMSFVKAVVTVFVYIAPVAVTFFVVVTFFAAFAFTFFVAAAVTFFVAVAIICFVAVAVTFFIAVFVTFFVAVAITFFFLLPSLSMLFSRSDFWRYTMIMAADKHLNEGVYKHLILTLTSTKSFIQTLSSCWPNVGAEAISLAEIAGLLFSTNCALRV